MTTSNTSDMAGSPYQHFEEAAALLANNPGEYEIEKSKALAALALAYEQRTANLIAYQANVERSYFQTLAKPRSGQANDLNRQIIERLGLA
jgi:hypothetical protein